MRTIIALLFLLGISAELKSQEVFVVMNIKGTVKVNGETLNRMDKITPETSLSFGTLDDYVKVISPRGFVTLRANNASKRASNEFIIAVKNALLPPTKFSGTHVRSDIGHTLALGSIYELKAHFRDTVLLIDTTEYEITGAEFLQNQTNYFELQFIHNRDTNYYQLPYKENKLLLSSSILLADYPELVLPQKVRLYYQKEGASKPKYISVFHLNHISKNEVMETIEFLKDRNELDKATLLREYLTPYLSAAFGKPSFRQLKTIYEEFEEQLKH